MLSFCQNCRKRSLDACAIAADRGQFCAFGFGATLNVSPRCCSSGGFTYSEIATTATKKSWWRFKGDRIRRACRYFIALDFREALRNITHDRHGADCRLHLVSQQNRW